MIMIFFTSEYEAQLGDLISIYIKNMDFWIVQPQLFSSSLSLSFCGFTKHVTSSLKLILLTQSYARTSICIHIHCI